MFKGENRRLVRGGRSFRTVAHLKAATDRALIDATDQVPTWIVEMLETGWLETSLVDDVEWVEPVMRLGTAFVMVGPLKLSGRIIREVCGATSPDRETQLLDTQHAVDKIRNRAGVALGPRLELPVVPTPGPVTTSDGPSARPEASTPPVRRIPQPTPLATSSDVRVTPMSRAHRAEEIRYKMLALCALHRKLLVRMQSAGGNPAVYAIAREATTMAVSITREMRIRPTGEVEW